MILILTSASDSHADLVERKLCARGQRVLRFDPAALTSSAQLSVHTASCGRRTVLTVDGESIDLSTLRAGWMRRPGRPPAPASLQGTRWQPYVEREWARIIDETFDDLPIAWLPGSRETHRAADNKQRQLRIAAELGLAVPASLLTNRSADFVAFYRDQDGRLIDKMPSTEIIKVSNERRDLAVYRYTQPVATRDLAYAHRLQTSPMLFQERLEKDFELRVTVVDEQVMAAAIWSQESASTRLDWRRYDGERTPYTRHELPAPVRERCLALTRRLGLRFAAIDLVVDKRGEYVFLEVNPNGQWQWIEEATGLPISDAICDALVK